MSNDPKQRAFLAERLRSEALVAGRVGQYGRLAAIADEVERLEAKVARVEALASGLQEQYEASDYSETASLGEMVKAIRTALAEPGRDEEGTVQPLSVLCNSCGRALANVGEWCCSRFTTAADVTTIDRDHVAEADELRKQRKG